MAGEPKMVNRLELFLFKLQSAFGSAHGALTASDFADVEEGSLENDLQMDEVRSAEGYFGQPQMIPGNMPGTVSLSYIMRSNGEASPGYWSIPFQCCAMKESTLNDVSDYTPTSSYSEWKDGTCWHYTGSQVAGGALLEKMSNTMFDWEMTLTPGKVARIVYTGKGAHLGASTAATSPTVTRSTTQLAAPVLGSTVSIMGYAYKFTELKITGTINADTTVDPSATYGHSYTLPTDYQIRWTAKLYAVLPSDANAFSQLLAGTQAAFSVAWGSAPNAFTVSAPNSHAQIISRKKSEQNGITTLDLEGIFVGNDFQVEVNTVVA